MTENHQWLSRNVQRAGVALLLGTSLFGASASSRSSGFLGPAVQQLETVLIDFRIQWPVVLCVTSYCLLFNWLLNREAWRSLERCRGEVVWLTSLLSIGLLVYICDMASASRLPQALTFLSGCTLGAVAAWWVGAGVGGGAIVSLIRLLIVFLLVASFWAPESDRVYEYRGQLRWTGPWANPNTFGLLMGTGMLLAAATAGMEWKHCNRKNIAGGKVLLPRLVRFAFYLVAVLFLARGLFHSLGRGAWMATGCGLCYLIGFVFVLFGARNVIVSQVVVKANHDRWIWPTRGNGLVAVVLFVSVTTLCFWHFGATELYPARRLFSAVNAVDFSWRNRVAAWEGALQISAEHPWLGAGWNEPESLYEHYYLPQKLTESAAIEMNDYLLLGATLGIPALFCFAMYLGLTLTGNAECRDGGKRRADEGWPGGKRMAGTKAEGEKAETESLLAEKGGIPSAFSVQPLALSIACRAGAIVLLVGFWFDGGLFKLPTAATFWILLELGNVRHESHE